MDATGIEMDDDAVSCATISGDGSDHVSLELGSENAEQLVGVAENGETLQRLGSVGEALTRVGIDIACSSEKLVNLNILVMHVEGREGDYETFASEPDDKLDISAEKALEFDLLSGILDSEVTELDTFFAEIQSEIVSARDMMSSCEDLGEDFGNMFDKLHDFEDSLRDSTKLISEMRVQSAEFQRMLLTSSEEENRNVEKDSYGSQSGQFSNVYAKINMQTAEQQRNILRTLEKSLARELDLEKKVTESRVVEEELRLRLRSSEREILFVDEEVAVALEKLLEADSASEVLKSTAKELIDRLEDSEFNLNGSVLREADLKLQLRNCMDQLKTKEIALEKLASQSTELYDLILKQTNSLKAILREVEDELLGSSSEASITTKKVGSLEEQLKESKYQVLNAKSSLDGTLEQHTVFLSDLSELKKVIEELKRRYLEAESRADSAELKIESLAEINKKLSEELVLEERGSTPEKVASFERQLRESGIRLEEAKASAEASQERQNMLYSSIEDMNNLIEDMKMKVSTTQREAESAEEKCIILSESNADLKEELTFMRSRLKLLEASLHQAEGTKLETAKGINFQTKLITDLVMQLAIERERLYKQISSLTEENKVLVTKLKRQGNMDFPIKAEVYQEVNERDLCGGPGFTSSPTCTKAQELSTPEVEESKISEYVSAVSAVAGATNTTSHVRSIRTIDARLLTFKHYFAALLILLISVYLVLQEECPF